MGRTFSALVRNLVPRPSASPATFAISHPSKGVVHSVERSTPADITSALDSLSSGLQKWKSTPLAERAAVFSRAAEILSDESSGWAARLVESNMAETSVTKWWSVAQIGMATGALRTLAGSAEAALKEEEVALEHGTVTIGREPYGVCLAIAAWNAVHVLTVRAIATPLLAGNTVVLKTSETTPGSQALWAELLYAAGLPRDALCVLHVCPADAAELTTLLVSDTRVRHVNFTGSTRVGSIIASLAGKHLKPTLMELGGKAPVILLPDADLDTAASHLIFGAFMNAGQICMSTERILVPASKRDALLAALARAWEAVEAQPRALFTPASGERVRSLIAQAVGAGASPVLGLRKDADAFVTPTMLADVTPDMQLYGDESFGPLAAIVSVPDADEVALIDEMVRIANDTPYGLAAAVWGRDVERATAVAKRIEAGAVHVNAPTPADPPTVPHGGWKSSGWGRFNGVEGLRSFTQTRSIEVVKDPHALPLNIFEL